LPIALHEANGINVESRGIPISERLLHASFLLGVGGNSQKHVFALDARNVDEIEADARAVVVLVQDFNLIVDLGVCDKTAFKGLIGVNDVEVDIESSCGILRLRWKALRLEEAFV
jgi:hypothetical protein